MSEALRNELRTLVERLPDEELPAARRYLQFLQEHGNEGELGDVEDELDASERGERDAAIKAAWNSYRAGVKTCSSEEMMARLRAGK